MIDLLNLSSIDLRDRDKESNMEIIKMAIVFCDYYGNRT